jgi:hypothetical protein
LAAKWRDSVTGLVSMGVEVGAEFYSESAVGKGALGAAIARDKGEERIGKENVESLVVAS